MLHAIDRGGWRADDVTRAEIARPSPRTMLLPTIGAALILLLFLSSAALKPPLVEARRCRKL
ncbi:hypothetical protein SLG_38020 [Sphingobium sp. SYK-6]|uniref:hypothetical protein n=1 Tax=Sphingobium sp. (strain NBRC 103272 / SYK-6) TaxID=627192 RepID=UPI0002277F55|nr:hypothetical protein [Sphingobium sp. SYK-6]BAK68477.1 hypothetical protein SLG_38020 [Sphingobium sp. SYK-6]